MKSFSFYHKDTGALHGRIISLNVPENELGEAIKANAPVDHLPISGAHHPDESRVDVSTKSVIPRTDGKRSSAQNTERRMLVLTRIVSAEARQARRVRELLIEKHGDDQLSAIDAEIQALRADLQALPSKPD